VPTAIASDIVTLKGGLTVSLDALQLLWALEHRQCVIKKGEDGLLEVGPRRLISDTECERIRVHKAELLALVTYCETVQ
jgi:hypothetical protein